MAARKNNRPESTVSTLTTPNQRKTSPPFILLIGRRVPNGNGQHSCGAIAQSDDPTFKLPAPIDAISLLRNRNDGHQIVAALIAFGFEMGGFRREIGVVACDSGAETLTSLT